MATSEGEFDSLPDEFEGIDWEAVPALSGPAHSEDATQNWSQSTTISRPASSGSSSQYPCDEFDDSFLAEVDALENQIIGAVTQGSSLDASATNVSSPPSALRQFQVTSNSTEDKYEPPCWSCKRKQPSPPIPTPSTKKSKAQDDSSGSVRQVLEDFKDEMTCPICCDMFVAAHVGNPCGHTVCGDCGWRWISKNKRTPTCAVCRAKLTPAVPMIPVFAVDNTVERHIQALGSSGNSEWQDGGAKMCEWQLRKKNWKRDAAERAAQSPGTRYERRTGFRNVVIDVEGFGSYIVPDDEEYGAYVEFRSRGRS